MSLIRSYKCSKCNSTMHNVTLEQVNQHKAGHGLEPIPTESKEYKKSQQYRRKRINKKLEVKKENAKLKPKSAEKLFERIQALENIVDRLIREINLNVKKKFKESFYTSDAWRKLRFEAFKNCGRVCNYCGATSSKNTVLHVDHIKPRKTHKHLELELSNLQILCEDCNLGKGASDDLNLSLTAASTSSLMVE